MESEQTDEFQLVSKQELEQLKQEVAKLQQNPVQDYQSSLTLIESMDRLADQLTQLNQLFDRANKEMYEDYQKGLHAESDKLDQVIAQNEKIAKGILALADHHTPSSSSMPESQPAPKHSEQTPPQQPAVTKTAQEPVQKQRTMSSIPQQPSLAGISKPPSPKQEAPQQPDTSSIPQPPPVQQQEPKQQANMDSMPQPPPVHKQAPIDEQLPGMTSDTADPAQYPLDQLSEMPQPAWKKKQKPRTRRSIVREFQ